MITTLPRLAAETGLTDREVRTAIKHLEDSGEISQITTNKFRLITVEKWAFFQAELSEAPDKGQSNDSQTTGVNRESKELNNILYMRQSKKPRKQNRFCNYTPTYDDDQIKEIERLEREQRLSDIGQ